MIPGSANSLLLASAAAGGYEIERSLRFNSSDSAYLSRSVSSAGNRRTWTFSAWAKRSAISASNNYTIFSSYTDGNNEAVISFSLDSLRIYSYISAYQVNIITTPVFRDPSSWYHIVAAFDTTNATQADRVLLYVNGVRITTFSTSVLPSQNYDGMVNAANSHYIGRDFTTSRYFSGCLADIHFIDSQALTPSAFGEFDTNGVWQPIAYAGSYGTNGFHLPFSDNSTAAALGTDTSGNGNTWTVNNLQVVTGGPTSVAAASGALPIYNTTDTYGTVKGSGTRTDSNASSIVLALPMDGANNGTTFTDTSATVKGSGSAKTATVVGNSKTSTAVSKYYGSSGAFDGSGDYLTFASNADFDFGTGDFSVESWVYLNSLPSGNGYPSAYWIVGWGPADSNSGFDFAVGSSNLILAISNFAAPTISVAHGMSVGRWYHLAATRSGNTARVFVDGIQVGSATTTETASTNPNGIAVCAAEPAGATGGNLNGYLQDLRIYKGAAKYTSNFNPPSSTQNPTIAAGNDSLVDSPTNGTQTDTGAGGEVVGNYCTMNPLSNGAGTLSNGNLQLGGISGAGLGRCNGTIAVSNGKWYFESTLTTAASYTNVGIGQGDITNQYPGQDSVSYAFTCEQAIKINSNSQPSYGVSLTTGDVLMVAFDLDNSKIFFGKNGTWMASSDPATGANPAFTLAAGTYKPIARPYDSTGVINVNFGQRPFAYTAPSGFKALNTANLPAPVVTKPSEYFNAITYSGNSGDGLPTTQDITTGFSPDFVWIKSRSDTNSHILFDIIRGAGKRLFSNLTNAEDTQTASLVSFNSDGFTVGGRDEVNDVGVNYISWTWDAGSSTVTNTDGSITSSVRANPSAGFSIVTYTGNSTAGATVGHGLGVTPGLIFTKARTTSYFWRVWHESLGTTTTNNLYLNATNGTTAIDTNGGNSNIGNNTIGFYASGTPAWTGVNQTGQDYVSYCFAPVNGYSNGFSYTGNGSADGSFVYLGFRPRLILLKCSSTTGNWTLVDTAREGYNVDNDPLYPNLSNAEGTTDLLDITSNGFKLRTTDASVNSNAATYIGFAWAESPFNYSRAR